MTEEMALGRGSLKNDRALYIVAGLCALLTVLLLYLTGLVVRGKTGVFDADMILYMRHFESPFVSEALRDYSGLGGIYVLTLIGLSAAIFLVMSARYGTLLYGLAAVIGGVLVSNLWKMGFDRERPNIIPHESYTVSASFPSGHALMAAVMYLALAVMLAGAFKQTYLKIFFFVCAAIVIFLVGLSRIYLGVHWPTDVIAGWMIGVIWVCLVWMAARAAFKV